MQGQKRKKRVRSTSCPCGNNRRRRSTFGYIQKGMCLPFLPEVCEPQTCISLGHWDRPEHKIVREKWEQLVYLKNKEQEDIEPDSLGCPVGMVCSSGPVKSGENTDSVRFATCLKAFALIYILPETEWTAENIDNLLVEGRLLLSDSKDIRSSNFRSSVYTDAELLVKRHFQIQGYTFTLDLEPRFLGDTKRPLETQPEQILSNLKPVLRAFFRQARYCLLWSSYGYILIWRRRRAYFVLDINGRKSNTFKATNMSGVAMLMCLKTLDNVHFLLTNMSGVNRTDSFTLREITVTKLVTPEGRIYARDSNSRGIEFKIINKNYAYLKSNLHLSLNPRDSLRNRSSIMVAVSGIVASKIDHPATWNTLMYDRVICYGVKLCRSCWDTCVNMGLPINLDTFPTQLRMGQFVIELKLLPGVFTGMWHCTQRYRATVFERILTEALSKHKHLLFQLNNQMYAVWQKNNFYYLLDPYKHTIIGTKLTDDTEMKWATIRMFRDMDTLVNVFHQVLMESNKTERFHIHAVQIRQLSECPKGYALAPLPNDVDVEAMSVNETICFPEDYQQCLDDLAYESGHEVDIDSYTDVPFDASFKLADKEEREHLAGMEEGEDAGGAGDMEGIELASDDEGVDNHATIDGVGKMKKKNMHKKVSKIKRKKKSVQIVEHDNDRKKYPHNPKGIKLKSIVKKEPIQLTKPIKPIRPTKPIKSHIDPLKPQPLYRFMLTKSNAKNQNEPDQVTQSTIKTKVKVCPCNCHSQVHEYKPDSYPGYTEYPQNMAVCGSESGTLESLQRLIQSAFKCADRVLTMTPWGNYVVFREIGDFGKKYYLFDGCTCDIDRFRHLDLRFGTAGLLSFCQQRDVIVHMIDSRETRALKMLRTRLDYTCQKFEKLKSRGP